MLPKICEEICANLSLLKSWGPPLYFWKSFRPFSFPPTQIFFQVPPFLKFSKFGFPPSFERGGNRLWMLMKKCWKNEISKKSNYDPYKEIPIYPILDPCYIFKSSIFWKPFIIAFHRHQNHDHSNFRSKDIDIQSQHLLRPCLGQNLT